MTKQARAMLRTIIYTGENFGLKYIIDILLGKEDERILKNQHNKIKTFAISHKFGNEEYWQNLCRQLIAYNYINIDLTRYAILRVTNSGRNFLRDELEFNGKKINLINNKTKTKSKNYSNEKHSELSTDDQNLYDKLKKYRSEIAKKQSIPAYIVFNNETLIDMVIKKPKSLIDFMKVRGIGKIKAEKYGNDFIKIINLVNRI